jgi:hypothetical protein
MALKIAGIEPVEFGSRNCKPRLDADKRLRLSQLKYDTDTNRAKANEVIASCFPDDEEFVLDFLRNEISETDRQLLALYLRGGQTAIDAYQKAYNQLMEEALAKAKTEGENDQN